MKTCDWCGKKILSRKASSRKKKHMFCNPECYHAWRREKYEFKTQDHDMTAYRKIKMFRAKIEEKKNGD